MTSLRIAGQTDVGQRRRDNQDTFISTTLWTAHTALLVVIDGVGGYAGGDRAAAIAKASIEQYMATPTGDTLTMLREAVVFANNQIAEQRSQDPQWGQMCCVLTAAVADAQARSVAFVHVGDTRLYRFRQSVLEKLTRDHSIVGIREDANQLTETEAMRHPRRNEILREVGSMVRRVDDPEFLEWGETDFQPGDVLLVCSDGLTDLLTRAQLTAVLAETLSLEEQVAELIRQANQAGGYDNITVVLAHNNTPAEAVISPASPAVPDTHSTASLTDRPLPTKAPANRPVQSQSVSLSRLAAWLGGFAFVALLIGFVYQPFRASRTPVPGADRLHPKNPRPGNARSGLTDSLGPKIPRQDTRGSVPGTYGNQLDSSRKP